MDSLFEKLVVGRDKGNELESNIDFFIESFQQPQLYGALCEFCIQVQPVL
jgi:hypothetical protein